LPLERMFNRIDCLPQSEGTPVGKGPKQVKAREGEAATRSVRLDPKLEASGWKLSGSVPVEQAQQLTATAVRELPTSAGPADYALCDSGSIRAVVEAKKVGAGPQEVLRQAERYSSGTSQEPRYQGEFGVPFLYSSNGELIWFHDVRHKLNRSRVISRFHTPSALREISRRDFDAEIAKIAEVPFSSWLRAYQREANEAIEATIRQRKRKMLVMMATGTGKTAMTVSEVYRLMKSGLARRVLFLVDRRALAAQTVRAFASFEAEPGLKFDKLYELYSQKFFKEDLGDEYEFDPKALPNKYLTDPQLGQAFVYVSTIQRMAINLFGRDAVLGFGSNDPDIEADADKLDIPIHAFDLIIADECHRGYSSKEMSVWRNTLDHFDAIKVGLTATPASHTTAYFENIAYRYEYQRAVAEGHLVDYDVVTVKSDVRMNGLFLKEGEQVENIDPMSGIRQLDLLEDERVFDTAKIERLITAPDANRKVLAEVKRYADEHEKLFGRPPKILIFADNDQPHTSHADQLVDQARDIFGRGDAYVAKITGRVDRPLQRIREFRNRPNPGIVVTVDLLTTGVDIPDLEFLVFLRPVKSRILFEQMLGRGTRKGEKFPDKSHFVVFDCFDGTLLAYFRSATAITAEPPESDGKTIVQVIDDVWQNRDRDYSIKRLTRRLRRIEKEMSGDARDLFARFVPDGDLGHFAEGLPAQLRDSFAETMNLLRDKPFQDLLTKYPRPDRIFLVAAGATDTVSSEWLIKGGIGQEFKPDDYLRLFSEFVQNNSTHIEALSILLSRPQGWGTEPLRELRKALAKAPEHFTEENLQRAHAVTSHKALADIISMVKRAAENGSSLYTAEERVGRAMDRVVARLSPTADQAKWLDYIRVHLIANLSIDRDDFENVPVLSNRGGWGRANQVFDGKLADVLADLNKELVAA
jgi:type I restriction enzyme, R subunit